jgi:hypothetical protein
VLDSTSPSYVGESTPASESETRLCARWCLPRKADEGLRLRGLLLEVEWREMAIGTDMTEWASSVSGSLSSSDLNI